MILKPEFAFPLSYYLIPFTGVVGMVIIVMCVILVSVHSLMSYYVFVEQTHVTLTMKGGLNMNTKYNSHSISNAVFLCCSGNSMRAVQKKAA